LAVPPELQAQESGQRLPQSKVDYLRRTVLEADGSRFGELLAGDSPEVRGAKTAYSRAKLEYMAAAQEAAEARQSLINAKEGLANAHGPVDALHFKWQVAVCQDDLTRATSRKGFKQKAVMKASARALATFEAAGQYSNGHHPLETGLDWTTPLPFDSAAEEVTTTLTADADGFLWRKTANPEQVAQRGGLVFPVGPAASPFTEQAAYTKARIGAGSSSSTAGLAGVKLSPGLQPDLPEGQVPVPPSTTSSPPRPQAAGATPQVLLKLPVAPLLVADQAGLEEDLLRALASDAGVRRERLKIPEARAGMLDRFEAAAMAGAAPGLLQLRGPGGAPRRGRGQ